MPVFRPGLEEEPMVREEWLGPVSVPEHSARRKRKEWEKSNSLSPHPSSHLVQHLQRWGACPTFAITLALALRALHLLASNNGVQGRVARECLNTPSLIAHGLDSSQPIDLGVSVWFPPRLLVDTISGLFTPGSGPSRPAGGGRQNRLFSVVVGPSHASLVITNWA